MPRARLGCSGWSYPHWHGGVFYPADLKRGAELEFYATVFDTVEINSSFYHLPQETTFTAWRQRTPEGFQLAVKASRYITHHLHLNHAAEPLALLRSRASLLGDKLGPILFQVPPSLHLHLDRLAEFAALLPPGGRFTFEFRHESWFCPEVYALLSAQNLALTIADSPRYPCVLQATADFVYLRLHGHEWLYASNYSEEQLREWANHTQRWLSEGKDVYCYFDNDAHGYAPANALTLCALLTP